MVEEDNKIANDLTMDSETDQTFQFLNLERVYMPIWVVKIQLVGWTKSHNRGIGRHIY